MASVALQIKCIKGGGNSKIFGKAKLLPPDYLPLNLELSVSTCTRSKL